MFLVKVNEGGLMFKLGEKQTLVITSRSAFGLLLCLDDDRENDVLLPNKFVEEEMLIDDRLEVFIYKDSKDRLTATTKEPKLMLGQIASLEVVDVTDIGVFLDWGLEKDLFLPFKQQKRTLTKGETLLVGLYIDKTDRLCATMDVYELLTGQSNYVAGEMVKGILYSINLERGGFVAIDGKYHGFIPNKELYGEYKLGQEIECRITDIREDGKLNLSIRKKAYQQMDGDSTIIFEALEKNDGALPYHDKTEPEVIKDVFGMSKRAFKRAIGRLLKEERITQDDNGMKLKKTEE